MQSWLLLAAVRQQSIHFAPGISMGICGTPRKVALVLLILIILQQEAKEQGDLDSPGLSLTEGCDEIKCLCTTSIT